MRQFFSTGLIVLTFLMLNSLPLQAATIQVSETQDGLGGGVCTLRNAIELINSDGTAPDTGCTNVGAGFGMDDTIELTATAPYTLTLTGSDENDNQEGDLDILANMTIRGLSLEQTVIQANFDPPDLDRVIHIGPASRAGGSRVDITVSLENLAITNGNTEEQNQPGGGVRSEGGTALNLMGVRIFENLAGNQGGGLYSESETLMIADSLIDNNQSGGDGGGAFFDGTTMIVGSEFRNNEAGIGNNGGAGLQQGSGGGILANNLTLILTSTVDSNTALSSGGGIYNDEEMIIVASTVSRNEVTGSSLSNGPTTQGASVGFGGGIFDEETGLLMINSTVSSNTTVGQGGGIFFVSGMSAAGETGLFTGGLFNVTVADNRVTAPNGIGGGVCIGCGSVAEGNPNAEIIFANTIVANNQAANAPDCTGVVTSQGYNLIGDSMGCTGFSPGSGDQIDVADAGLGPLQDNGGPTETHGLLMGSPAIDMGNPDPGCRAPDAQELFENQVMTTVVLDQDQRGFIRPIAVLDPATPRCDVGAFEFQTFDFEVTKEDGLGGASVSVGDSFTYLITVTNGGPGQASGVTLSDPLPAGLSALAATPSQGTCTAAASQVNCDLGDLAVGATVTVEIQVSVDQVTGTEFVNVVTVTSGGDSQSSVTKTAEAVTPAVGGGNFFFFGSGCSLGAGLPGGAHILGLALVALLALRTWRTRS